MASKIFNSFKRDIINGTIDLDTDTFKCMLVYASYTADIDDHLTTAHVSADEVSGTGYTAGGAAMAGLTAYVDNTDDEGVWDANDVTWSSSTITNAYGAVIWKSAASSALIAHIDFAADKSSVTGDFIVQWASEGIINLN